MPFPMETPGDLLLLTLKVRAHLSCEMFPNSFPWAFLQPLLPAIIVFCLCILCCISHVALMICSRICLPSLCLIIFVSGVLSRGPSQQTRLIIFLNEQMNEWRNHATQMASVLFMIKITPRSCNSLMSFSFLSSNKFLSSASCRSSLNDLKCRIQNWLPRNATSFPF